MIFGDYNQGRVFKIENSQMHKEAGSRVRSVEFILLKGKNGLWFIEAKSSSPKSETSWDRYQEFIGEITEKFIHSFNSINSLLSSKILICRSQHIVLIII